MKDIVSKLIRQAGGCSALGRSVGVTHAAIRRWKLMGRVPAERVLAVERITGVSRYQLRPDVYGDAPDSPQPPPPATDPGQEEAA